MKQQCPKTVCKSKFFSYKLITLTGSFWLAVLPFGFRDEDCLFACFGILSRALGFRVRSHLLPGPSRRGGGVGGVTRPLKKASVGK